MPLISAHGAGRAAAAGTWTRRLVLIQTLGNLTETRAHGTTAEDLPDDRGLRLVDLPFDMTINADVEICAIASVMEA